jgi:hypothetical protein
MNSQTIPQQIARMDSDRLRAYRENLDFYNGLQWPGRARRGERRITVNYAKAFVEKVTSYLMSDLNFSVEPDGGSTGAKDVARRTEEALYRVYDANNLGQLDFDTEMDCAVLGDGCFKVTWDVEQHRVRVTAPDVQGLFAWWAGDDPSRVWRVAIRYQLSAEEAALRYGVKNAKKQSTIVEVWTAEEFELWVDSAVVSQKKNPYGFIPFVIYPNLRQPKRFWGVSDLPPITEPAREINRALSQLSTILELSGNPIAVLENVEQATDIAVQPGAVWEIPESARAYLLDLLQGGGVRLHVDYIDLLYRALHDLSESPRTSFGDNQKGLSGVALEMELHPLMQKVKRKRLIRTAAYRRRNEMILRILEQKTGATYRPYRSRVLWGPVLPQDRSRLVRNEQILVESGIHSRRRAMEELGVEDVEAEFNRLRDEGEYRGNA